MTIFVAKTTPTILRLRQQLNLPPSSKSLSTVTTTTTTTTPSPSDIADLILRQTTPTHALSTYHYATTLPTFHHTPTTQSALVRALLSHRRLTAATQFITSLPSPPPDDVLLPLVRALPPSSAAKALAFSPRPSLRLLNAVLDALVKSNIDAARSFFRTRIVGCGIRADERTFGILMKGLCRTNRIDEGFRVLKFAKSKGLGGNAVIYNTLIHALCRNGKVGRARSLMSGMENPSDVTFNIMVSAYCREGDLVKALVMVESAALGLLPDVVSITKVVALFCEKERVFEAVELVGRVERKGVKIDVVCYNTLVLGFCKVGKLKAGEKIMREMELSGRCLPNVQTYNVLISGCCAAGKVDAAMDLFREMGVVGIGPDFETFGALIRGFCSAGRVSDGLRLLGLMEEEGQRRFGVDRVVEPYNSIVYGLYKEGRLEEAQGFLGRMRFSFPRVVSRSLMILGLCHMDRSLDAKKLFDEMVGQGDAPCVLVYASLVEGLCREDGGDLRSAFDVMNAMMNMGYQPKTSMLNVMINGFCREAEVVRAIRFLEEMACRGCFPDADSYGSVIGSLCRNNNIQRACGLLGEMVEKGIVPNCLTWNALVASVV